MKKIYLVLVMLVNLSVCFAQFKGRQADQSTTTAASNGDSTQIVGTNRQLDRWEIAITPDGDIKTALTENSNIPANGSLGFTADYFRGGIRKANIGFFFNIASTGNKLVANLDQNQNITNKKTYGNFLLIPNSVGRLGRSASINFAFYPIKPNTKLKNLGTSGFINVAEAEWHLQNDSSLVILNSGAIYLQYKLIPATSITGTKNSFEFAPFIGWTFRSIGGDIRSNPELRNKLIDTEKRFISGIEPGCLIAINGLRFTLSFPYFWRNIRGFGYGQLITSFGISSDIKI